jgi:hypothetical protein
LVDRAKQGVSSIVYQFFKEPIGLEVDELRPVAAIRELRIQPIEEEIE